MEETMTDWRKELRSNIEQLPRYRNKEINPNSNIVIILFYNSHERSS